MERIKVLFVCIHNSARSQMAEAFLNHYHADQFIAESAGIEPGDLNPVVVEVMKEVGIDISSNLTSSVQDFIDRGKIFNYVVTVCDEASAEWCPVFPGQARRIHMEFPDPSSIDADPEEKMRQIRVIRDSINEKLEKWVKSEF